jgi:hypothetical protein
MSADPTRVATARQMLAHLGVTLADLQADPGPGLPTLAEYLPHVIAAAGPGARRTYGTYRNRMTAVWGERTLDEIVASDIEAMQRQIAATARSRRNSRTGRHAGEHVIAAARAVYNRAIADGLIDAAASPAHRVFKPRRLPSTRRALSPQERRSTSSRGPPVTTWSSTRCCYACSPRPHAGAGKRSGCGLPT